MTQWIPVLVRLEDLEKVTALLAELEAGRDGSGLENVYEIAEARPTSTDSPGTDATEPWSVEQLARLASSSTATGQRWAKALDVCCDQPGTYLPTSKVAELSGMSITEWRDAPRKISRHLKAHFADVPREADGDLSWPLSAKSMPNHPGEVSWMATTETASRWSEVRHAQA
ncbi:hypothetical protein [Aeromicrobium sp. Leaf245]|uniref:hypothetical protein n=1 Tax=Aeromicrobium sp. Leaf245 TaxID=1736306 RepID=UPI0012E1C712|nr:hypothetical protein [Aeromicrobium sp. Leaf245]